MNATILCPGPSLSRYLAAPPPRAELVVGVNRAALVAEVDAWSCCDLPAILEWREKVIGSPVLIAGQEAVDNLRDRKVVYRGVHFDRREMFAFCPHAINWVWCSATTALVYAAYRGAKRITAYGCDWDGWEDWDGTRAGKNRSESRWQEEARLWGALTIWLGEQGITVERVK